MSKNDAKQPRPWKYYARDCRGRFIKKRKKTPEELADGTERMTIPDKEPVWLYVQLDCKEDDFYEAWRRHPIEVLKNKASLSLLPWLKTWKVLLYGHLYRNELKDEPGVYRVDHTKSGVSVTYCDYGKLIPYEQVVALRQSSSSPLEVTTDYSEYNFGVANIGVHNVGIRNFGYYNKGVECMGMFNTDPTCFHVFNKPYYGGLTFYDLYEQLPLFLQDAVEHPDWPATMKHIGPLKSFEKHKSDPTWPEQYKALISLPNFDYAIFEEITGISKKMLNDANKAWKKKYGKHK